MNLTSFRNLSFCMVMICLGVCLSTQPSSSLTLGAWAWVPWTPCPVLNLCRVADHRVRTLVGGRDEWVHRGMIVRLCWGPDSIPGRELGSLALRNSSSSSLRPGLPLQQLHSAFCLWLIKRCNLNPWNLPGMEHVFTQGNEHGDFIPSLNKSHSPKKFGQDAGNRTGAWNWTFCKRPVSKFETVATGQSWVWFLGVAGAFSHRREAEIGNKPSAVTG